VKVGDLVTFRSFIGLILKTTKDEYPSYAYVSWFNARTGIPELEWMNPFLLEVISESR
jgi:hypothetical protein